MRKIIRILLLQELDYGIFVLVFGISIGFQHGVYSGLKAFGLAFIFMQFVILWVNRGVIKAAFEASKS